jgi:hypothetical protein
MLRPIRALLVALAATFIAAPIGCGETDPVDSASEDLTQKISFEEIDAHKSEAAAGLTVIKSAGAYHDFFGEPPPESVDFQKHWVVHVSTGVKNTGGYAVEVAAIEKKGGKTKTLVVRAIDHQPGAGCVVTQALTNPQIAVRINKQPSTPKSNLDIAVEEVSCQPSCEEIGGTCRSSTLDVTFPANCQSEFGEAQADGACEAFNQACCVSCPSLTPPPPDFCPDGDTEAVVGEDGCVHSFECVERTPVTGQCIKNSNDACASDADCAVGGCGGELCFNPEVSGGISTCECTTPAASCGCVAGKCSWWE